MNKIILLLFIGFTITYSQSVKVLENKLLTDKETEQFFHPHFSGDDSKVIITKSNYKGLYSLNLATETLETITEEQGAGYKPLITPDRKTIVYRPFVIKSGKKYNLLKSIDIDNKALNIIESEQRNISVPNQLNAKKMFYLNNKKVKEFSLPTKEMAKTQKQNKAVYVENNSLYLIENNETVELNPLGKGVYVWASLSPDGEKMIFTFGNKGTYVCDLAGKILLNIEDAHYPKFSPNGKYISYMIDKDNGYNYISSDLFVYSIDEQKSYPITKTDDKIEMFADWSHNGNEIVYNTLDGEIYLMKLDIKN
jgi:Tol biopolymer transport system component